MTELSGSGHDSSYHDDRSDHERERHREKKKKKKKKSEKEKYLDDEERRKRKVKEGGGPETLGGQRTGVPGRREWGDLFVATRRPRGQLLQSWLSVHRFPPDPWGGAWPGWEPARSRDSGRWFLLLASRFPLETGGLFKTVCVACLCFPGGEEAEAGEGAL